MTALLNSLYSLSANELYTPLGLTVTFFLAFLGEFGIAVPFYMDAIYLGAGVALVHGSAIGLVLFPINMASAALGAGLCNWALVRGFTWIGRLVRRRASPKTMAALMRMTNATPIVIALVRELPAMQLAPHRGVGGGPRVPETPDDRRSPVCGAARRQSHGPRGHFWANPV